MTVTATPVPSRAIATHFDRPVAPPTGPTGHPRRERSRTWRARWAAIGAAIAVVAGTGGVAFSGATNAQITPSQTLITPCRIMDTRSGPSNVGPRNTPLAGGETYTIQVTGTNGNCTIPSGTSGIVMNVTIVGPGSNGFLTVFPGGATRPTASNLNYVAGQAPTPNQVTVALGATGQVSFFASGGPVNVIADVAGYTTAARLTNTQLAQNRWDQDLAKPATIALGDGNSGQDIVFDGTSIWVSNTSADTVTRINPVTNAVVGSPIAVGSEPAGLAFDGTNVWVANRNSNNVTRINAASGTVVGAPIAVGTNPVAMAYDGTNMWVVNEGSNNVTRVNASSGLVLPGTTAVGAGPTAIAYDGSVMWVVNGAGSTVTRINGTSGAVIGPAIAVAAAPSDIAFDGTNMWIPAVSGGQVTRINVNTVTIVAPTINVPAGPLQIAFDGSSMWVSRATADPVRIGAAVGTVFSTGIVALGAKDVVFDGTNVWFTSNSAAELIKARTS